MDKTDKIANAFYNEDFKELERLTKIKAKNLYEFEVKWDRAKGGKE